MASSNGTSHSLTHLHTNSQEGEPNPTSLRSINFLNLWMLFHMGRGTPACMGPRSGSGVVGLGPEQLRLKENRAITHRAAQYGATNAHGLSYVETQGERREKGCFGVGAMSDRITMIRFFFIHVTSFDS